MTRGTAGRAAVVAVVAGSLAVSAAGIAKTKPPPKLHLRGRPERQAEVQQDQLSVKPASTALIKKNPGASGRSTASP